MDDLVRGCNSCSGRIIFPNQKGLHFYLEGKCESCGKYYVYDERTNKFFGLKKDPQLFNTLRIALYFLAAIIVSISVMQINSGSGFSPDLLFLFVLLSFGLILAESVACGAVFIGGFFAHPQKSIQEFRFIQIVSIVSIIALGAMLLI